MMLSEPRCSLRGRRRPGATAAHARASAPRDSTGKTVRDLYGASDPEYCDFLLDVYRTLARGVVARITATLCPVDRTYRSADSLLLPLDRTVGFILNDVLFC
jgi:hypothetical protein